MDIRNSQSHSRVTLSEESETIVVRSKKVRKYIPDDEESETIVVRSKKVRKYIPDDVSLSIVCKLPLKSLKRFECACKTWSVLLQNSYFINMFNNNNSLMSVSKDYENTYLIRQHYKRHDTNTNPCEFYLLPDNVFQNRVKIDWPLPFQVQESIDNIYILGSVSIDGIFCLKNNNRETSPVLWNPTTLEYKLIPPSPHYAAHYALHGFGYDSVTNDYKVLQLTYYHPLNTQIKIPRYWNKKIKSRIEKHFKSSWELYSLRNNSWKELDSSNRYYYTIPRCIGVYVNGVSHWWAISKEQYYYEECLVSFDYSNEVFFTTPPPSYLPLILGVHKHLVPLNDSIALISTDKFINTLHISVLGELGVKESWTKLFVINHLPFFERPIGVGIKNNVFFFMQTTGDLACIDLNTKMIQQDLGVNPSHNGTQIGKYKKSSLPIGGMHN